MIVTEPSFNIFAKNLGYVVNSEFIPVDQRKIIELAQRFRQQFGKAVFVPEPSWLHITLMDWLAPLVDYGRDKRAIFPDIYKQYWNALLSATGGIGPIEVDFNQIQVSPQAIIIKGEDSGQYQKIRNNFIDKIKLLSGTKQPPQIIHSTIARFTDAIELAPIEQFAADQEFSLRVTIDSFRLIQQKDNAMRDYGVLNEIHLAD